MKLAFEGAATILLIAGLAGSIMKLWPDLVSIPMVLPAIALFAIDRWRFR